ncbi:MAG TPA: hypothetical protein VJW55_04815 [Candidatus Angelobacter sp.]|nr:hypothetical protein [Candidatus Angelobacter sp.]
MRRLEQTVLGLLAVAATLAVWRPSVNFEEAFPSARLLLYIVPIVVLPLVFYVLFRFAYGIFLRPYLRLWRMRRYRSNKELMAAVKRRQ